MTDACEKTVNRATVLTSVGRGAVAVVRVEGSAALAAIDQAFIAANSRPLGQQVPGQIVFGRFQIGDANEEVVVCPLEKATVEVHCHGGRVAATRILDHLAAHGCDVVPWPDWIRGCEEDLVVAEARVALADAATMRTAAILLDQLGGALSRETASVATNLRAGETDTAATRIDALLDHATLGLHLTTPWQVVIAGLPNVGKSSLINVLLGYERSIVFDQPGTTRDVLTAAAAFDGWPVELIDVAGLRDSADDIETAGIELARQKIAAADLLLWVIDATALMGNDMEDLSQLVSRQAQQWLPANLAAPPTLAVVNKIDLAPQLSAPDETAAPVSALTGDGIGGLINRTALTLAPNSPHSGEGVPFTDRQVRTLSEIRAAIAANEVPAAVHLLDSLIYAG